MVIVTGDASPRYSSRPIAAHVEGSAASFRITCKFGTLISQAGGSTLLLDYGTEQAVGDFRVHILSCVTARIS
jgi:hypothetical protein